ncbi:hypothetical protein Q3G72_028112 [Acer saccharum]|nr:hypothetical protein Q3G72_028112 [Acer saccharum]
MSGYDWNSSNGFNPPLPNYQSLNWCVICHRVFYTIAALRDHYDANNHENPLQQPYYVFNAPPARSLQVFNLQNNNLQVQETNRNLGFPLLPPQIHAPIPAPQAPVPVRNENQILQQQLRQRFRQRLRQRLHQRLQQRLVQLNVNMRPRAPDAQPNQHVARVPDVIDLDYDDEVMPQNNAHDLHFLRKQNRLAATNEIQKTQPLRNIKVPELPKMAPNNLQSRTLP